MTNQQDVPQLGKGLCKSAFSLAIATTLATGLVPMSALAEETASSEGTQTEASTTAEPITHSLAGTGLSVSGGVEGTDFTVDATAKKVIFTSAKTMTVSGVSQGYSLEVAPGNHATLILAGVTIEFDRESRTGDDLYRVPLDVATNMMDVGGTERTTPATVASEITNKTSLHLILADGTTNTLTAGFGAPALHCGEGSELMIDDSVLNFDNNGNHITPDEGRVPFDTTLSNGTSISTGDPLYTMDSTDPGKLICLGGSGGAGIGSGAHEDSGYLVFDGGLIETSAYGTTSTPAAGTTAAQATELYCGGTGAGVGGSFGGGGTLTIFNGGVVTAVGSFHGAGIGAGCVSTPGPWSGTTGGTDAGTHYDFPTASRTQLPNTIASKNGTNAPHPDSQAGAPNAGSITVNGGNVTSEGFVHGYAFGNACGSRSNAGGELLITGGNLTPINRGNANLLLGALGMNITVQGGSFYAPSSGFTGTVTDGRGQTLTMVTIDLAGFDELHNKQLKSLTVTVNGAPLTNNDGSAYEYGLPYGVDENGRVFFWLPSTVNGKTVSISNFVISTLDENGNRHDTTSDYDFVVPSVGTGSLAKRYVEINVDSYVAQTPGLRETLFKRYDGVEISINNSLVNTIAGFKVPAVEPKDQYLTAPEMMNIAYHRTLDRNGDPTTDEIKKDGGYSDVGSYEVIVESTEWSGDANFSHSFWGHKLYLSSAIEAADSEVSVVTHTIDYDEVLGTGANGLSSVTLAAEVMPRTYATDDLPAEATTCKAPTGTLQFYANGVPIGDPVTLSAGGTNDKGYAYSTAVLKWTDFENYQIPRNAKGTVEIQGVYLGGTNFNASEGMSTEIEASDAKDFPFMDTPEIIVKPQNPDPDAPSVPVLKPEGLPTVGKPDPDAENKDLKNTLHNTVYDSYYMPVKEDGEPLDESALLAWAQSRYEIPANCDFGTITITQGKDQISAIPTNTPGAYEVTIPVRDRVTGNTTTLVVDLHLGLPPTVIPGKPQPGTEPGTPLPVIDVTQEPNRGTLEGSTSDTVSRPVRPNQTETPDTIKDWIENYYTIPEGCIVSTPTLKDADGNELKTIDGSKPGSYIVEYDAVDPQGNVTHVKVNYNLRDEPTLTPQDPTKSDLVDKGTEVTPEDTLHKDYEDTLPVIVVVDPTTTPDPLTREDIIKEANDRYVIPEDWTVDVKITDPEGNPVDDIDLKTPGIYTAVLTYTTPNGDTITTTLYYHVKHDGSHEPLPLPGTGNGDNTSNGVGSVNGGGSHGENPADGIGGIHGAQGEEEQALAGKLTRLAKTGDSTTMGITGLIGALFISGITLLIGRFRRRHE